MKQKTLLLSIIFLLIQNVSFSQSLRDSIFQDCKILIDSQQHVKALAQFEEISSQFPKNGREEILDLQYLIALEAYGRGDFETALIWWRDSILQKRITLSGTKNFKTIKTMHNIGAMYENLGQSRKYLNTVEETINIIQRGLDPLSSKDSINLANKFLDYSYLYRKIEDFNKAEQCLNKARLLMNESSSAKLNQKFNNYAGMLYSFKGDQVPAKSYLLKSIANNTTKIPANIQYNLALVYYKLEQLDSAYYHCQAAKITNIKNNRKNRNNKNISRCFNLLGLISHKRKNYLEALQNYQHSIEFLSSDLYPNSSLAAGYENIADSYSSQKSYDQALKYYQQSLSYLSNQRNPLHTIEDNPIVSQIDPTELNKTIRVLGLKIKALYDAYQIQKQKKYLEIALETSNTMDTLVHNFRLFNKSGEDKVTLSEAVLPYYENSILVAQELYQVSQAPRYLEKAYQALLNIKGIVLLEEIKAKEVLYSFAPKAIIEKETRLREAIYQLENILSITSGTEKVEVVQKHFEAKTKYEQYLKKIEEQYPNYYTAKFDYQESNSLSEIQAKLADNMLIFDFLEGTEGLCLFGISKTQINLETIKDKNRIDSTIRQINQSLDLKAIHPKAVTLYSSLVQPTLTAHQKKFEHLIFIKSGFLHNLAFDLLRTNNQRYLIEEYKLCELYSAKQLLQEKRYGEKDFEYLGFAIDYQDLKDHQRHLQLPDDSIYLNQLNAVEGEVRHGKKLFSNTSYFNQEVSIEQLKNHLTRSSNIIHFSMHAISSPEALQSGLIVYDQEQQFAIFNKNDIMAHRLNNDLTILSACKTGAGKQYKGEGVMSLARAFFNAGSQSVLVSTNSAADHSSQKIMSLLLDYIKEGKTKDEALQLAKLKYLAEASPAYQHPKYWAYFSIIGNTDSIAFAAPRWTNYLVIIIACLLILAGLLYYQRTKKNSTPA